LLRSQPHDREILRLAVPAFFTLIAEPLYLLADTAVVGHLGTSQLGGLAVASSILLIGYSLFIFLAYGTTAAVARLVGADQHPEAAHQAVQGMWLALGAGVGCAAVGFVFADPLVRLLGAEGAVATNALVYLRISLVGFPALLVALSGTGYLRGLQDTRTPLFVAIGSSLFNLVLEVVLIIGLGYGIGASAGATVVAQYCAAGLYVWWVVRAVRLHRVGLGPHPPSIARLAVVGRDLFVRTAALRGSFVVATAVAARLGTTDLAAYQIGFQVWNFLALGLDAVAIAAQVLVGRFLGADDAEEARLASKRMLEWGVGLGVVLGIGVAVLHGVIPHVFTSDPSVVALTSFCLLWVAVMQPLNGVVFTLDGVLIGAGDQRYLATAMAISAAVFVPAAGAVLATDAGLGWLWAALALFMVVRAATLLVRYRDRRWARTGALLR
jgi:putative MATE family efflux protein